MLNKPKFLYHGTSKRVDVLMPYQADDYKYEAGRRFGVYATSDKNIALAFALGAIPDETGTCSRVIKDKDRNPLKMVFVRGHPNFGGKGYLFKLSSKGFHQVSKDQWVCDHPVRPTKITEINVDDYLHLFRYATEEEKQEIEREFKKKQRNRKKDK